MAQVEFAWGEIYVHLSYYSPLVLFLGSLLGSAQEWRWQGCEYVQVLISTPLELLLYIATPFRTMQESSASPTSQLQFEVGIPRGDHDHFWQLACGKSQKKPRHDALFEESYEQQTVRLQATNFHISSNAVDTLCCGPC